MSDATPPAALAPSPPGLSASPEARLPVLGAPSAPGTPELEVARKVLRDALRVKRGENVIIETWPHTLAYARAFVIEARRMGARPMVLYEDEEAYWTGVGELDPKVLGTVGEHEWAALGKAQAYVFLWGPENLSRIQRMDPKVRNKVRAYNPEWYARAQRARLRGARMEIGRASDDMAREFNVDPTAWRQELLEGSLVDTSALVKEGNRVASQLRKGKDLTVEHPNGTHITLRLLGKTPQVEDGVVGPADVAEGNNMTSIPAGLVNVALDERIAEGTFRANRTSYLASHPAEGGEWTFAKGHLTAYSYRSGGEAFSKPYEQPPKKGKDQVGMLSIGLNPRIHRAPRLEDQERGTVCLTLGTNVELGGRNRAPFLTWLALGGATVKVDGKVLIDQGNIV